MTFSDIIDAADNLSLDEQEALVEILRRRIAEANRAQLVREVKAARADFATGDASPTTVAEIMEEAQREP